MFFVSDKQERILVTGSTGMLGSSFVDVLSEKKRSFLAPKRQELDLNDSKAIYEYLAKTRPSTIIHCAAVVGGINANILKPADFIMDNVQIDSSLFYAARRLGIPNLIYFGSSCMYPRDSKQPMKEDMILTGALEPTNLGYAIAKIASCKIVESVSKQDGLNWRALILSNLYGPRDNFNPQSSHLVASIIHKLEDALKNKEKKVEIWGRGTSRREFTYVEDVCRFVIENLSNCHEWPSLMNLGSGYDLSVNEYYELIASLMGYEGKFINDISKPDGMPFKRLDSTIARNHGWNPNFDLKLGILGTIQWYRENVSGQWNHTIH
jgi:GDP-L-fucose synthase